MNKRILACAAAAILAVVGLSSYTIPAAPDLEAAVVKVELPNGHGSGIHVGGGYIVTAAHVAGKETTVKLRSEGGKAVEGTVLWVNTAYDIALIKTDEDAFGSAPLSCSSAKRGDTITAMGNPLGIEFVSSTGRIAGKAREVGPWKSVFVTDMTIVMGMSGGPVFNDAGEVIGITVGVMAANMGFSSSLLGFGYVVPSSAVCHLMGRTV